MLTKMHAFVAGAALAAALGSTGLASAQTYQLNFDTPRQVGDKFEMRGEGASMQEIFTRVDGETVEEVANHGEAMVHARCEVLALNEAGGVSQMAYDLIEYEFEFNSEALELDTSRRLIATAADGEVTYAYEGGGAVGEGFEDALELLLGMPIDTDGEGADDNIVMNAQDPREVGENWEMNHAYMAQSMTEDGELTLDPDDINSNVTLVEVAENEAGVSMASVEAEATATNIGFAPGQLPPFLKVTDSGFRVRITGELALDATSAYGLQQFEMEMGFLAKGKSPEGELVELEVEYERESEVSYAPIAD